MHWEGGKFKLFSEESDFTGQIFSGEIREIIKYD